MCGGGGGDGGARAREEARQSRISEGIRKIESIFSRFDDPFYGDIEQSYLDYALPDLERQQNAAARDLTLALARGGNLASSTRGRRFAEFQEEEDIARQSIADRAKTFGNEARGRVEQARANLISQNASMADPAAIGNLALSQAENLSRSPAFDPIGPLFQNVTAGIATAVDADRRRAALDAVNRLRLAPITGRGASRVVT